MAKLTNVKTLDMVNGEITRIEYDGAVYGRVADGASIQDGDIGLRVNSPADWADIGSYYPIVNNGRSYKDNNGYPRLMVKRHFVYFRKINAETSPKLTDRVDALEARVDRLEGAAEPAESLIGKRVRIIDGVGVGVTGLAVESPSPSVMDLAVKPDAEHAYRATRSDGLITKFAYNVEVIDEKPALKTEKRRAKVGERILITNAYKTSGYYKDGDVLTVTKSVDECDMWIPHVEVEGVGTTINDSEYEVIAEEPAPPQLKVGDYAKVVGGRVHNYKKDDIVKITKIRQSDDAKWCERLTDGKGQLVYKDDIVKATDEEVVRAKEESKAQAEQAKWAAIGRKPNEYKEGDIVDVSKDSAVDFGAATILSGPRGSSLGGNYTVKMIGSEERVIVLGDNMRLIAPVEARFDS